MSFQRYLALTTLVTVVSISMGAVPSFANERVFNSSQRNHSTTPANINSNSSEVEDNQSEVQFQIQLGTSDLQNAENVRSQAERRLEQQRRDLTRNWQG